MVSHTLGKVLMTSRVPREWAGDRPPTDVDLIHQWALALGADHKCAKTLAGSALASYLIVLANLDREIWPYLAHLVRQKPDNSKWISLVEGDISQYTNPTADLINILRASDAILAINPQTASYFQAISGRPAICLGFPYPVESIKALAGVRPASTQPLLCVTKENSGPSIAAANATGLPFAAMVSPLHRKKENFATFAKHRTLDRNLSLRLAERLFDCPNLTCIPQVRSLSEFLKVASGYKVWMNLDVRHTFAQVVLDGAALGIPVIAPTQTGHMEQLFPDLCLESPYDCATAASLAQRLISEPDFYAHVQQTASSRIADLYEPRKLVKQLEVAVKALP